MNDIKRQNNTIINIWRVKKFDSVVAPIVSLLNNILIPMLLIVGAAGALKNAIIGFVLIFVLILALKLLMPIMVNWVNSNGGNIALH